MKVSDLKTLASVVLLLIAFAGSPKADGTPTDEDVLQGVLIHDASVAPGLAGGAVRVRLVIENLSAEGVFLDGLRSNTSKDGELFVIDGGDASAVRAGLAILQGETLDLASSHIGARLTGLDRPLRPGDHIDLTLEFRRGAVTIPAHVGSASEQ